MKKFTVITIYYDFDKDRVVTNINRSDEMSKKELRVAVVGLLANLEKEITDENDKNKNNV